jgi:predicted regulator of Ras-like GTPase activity (Roadblock/LC7/MglB family)
MSELKKILENFCKLEGVRGALVVGADGSIEDSFADKPIEEGSIATLVNACAALGGRTAEDLHLDSVNQFYVEYEGFSVTSEAIGKRSLVIVADPGANLGRIRLEIRKNKKVIEGAGE